MKDLIDPIFQSTENFNNAFVSGLETMLKSDELGVFILVLANANNDKDLWQKLKDQLLEKFTKLKNSPLTGSEDDIKVFKQLLNIDLENLEPTQIKQLGIFELQYNPLRALRPSRLSQTKTTGTFEAFNPSAFNFNADFLQQELFYQGQLFGKQIALFYNKFPFADKHGLLVVEKDKNHPQFLSAELHQFAWMMVNAISLQIPGFSLSYNAYGAYASVNHFHLQCFIRTSELPLENDEKYPLIHHNFRSVSDAWTMIETLHQDQQPYNLIYQNNKILLVVRKRQDDYTHASWTAGYAWYEACGGVNVSNLEDFNQLTTADLQTELEKLKIT